MAIGMPFRYSAVMSILPKMHFSPAASRVRKTDALREAMVVQAIEENPLDAEQVEMFEMFEREGWSHEQRRAHLMARTLHHATARD